MIRIGMSLQQLRSPLARRLIVAIVLVSSVITLVLTGLQLYSEYRGQLNEIDATFQRIEDSRLDSVTQSLWTINLPDLRLQLTGIVRLPNLEYAAVREGEKLWAEAGQRTSRDAIERQYAMKRQHLGSMHELGTLTVVAGLDAIHRQLIVRAFVILASNALKTFLVAAFAFAFFYRLVNRHLTAIAGHVRGIDLRRRASPLKLARAARPRPDELDELVAEINLLQENAHSTLAALRESEERFRIMANAAPMLLWTSGPDKRCTFFNTKWLEFTGRTLEQELGDGWAEGVHADDLGHCLETYVKSFEARRPFEMEYRLRCLDGEYRWVFDKGVPRFDASGKFVGYIGSGVDITERKRAENALRENAERLQQMSRRLGAVRDQQSRDIARELHDRVGQNLTVLGINLTRLRDEEVSAPKTRARINDSLAVIEATGKVISDVLTELKPPMLSNQGLPEALRFHVKQLAQRTSIAIKVQDSATPRLSPEIEMALFRIAQGALNNVVQHARARNIVVQLEAVDGMARLEVVDDGSGFDVTACSVSGSWGLTAMKERAEAIDGSLRIESAPGRGTRIIVEAPVAS